MATHQYTPSRRTILAAFATAPAIGGIAASLAAIEPAEAATVDRRAWDRALAAFRKVDAVHDDLWGRWEAACEAMDESTPERVDRYFDEYKLGMSMSRDDVEFWLRSYVGRTGKRIDIARTADEFADYQRVHREARERFQTEQLYEAAKAHNAAYYRARDTLMAIAAPTVPALLVKIEIATTSLDDEHAESMLADARRLLARSA